MTGLAPASFLDLCAREALGVDPSGVRRLQVSTLDAAEHALAGALAAVREAAAPAPLGTAPGQDGARPAPRRLIKRVRTFDLGGDDESDDGAAGAARPRAAAAVAAAAGDEDEADDDEDSPASVGPADASAISDR